jgi:hypothetical protein
VVVDAQPAKKSKYEQRTKIAVNFICDSLLSNGNFRDGILRMNFNQVTNIPVIQSDTPLAIWGAPRRYPNRAGEVEEEGWGT